MPLSSLNLAFRLSAAGLCISLALSVAAARWYSLPNLLAFSGQDVYREKDFWFVMASGAMALGSAAFALYASCSTAKTTCGGVTAGVIAWVGLTAILLAFWFSYVLYYALWLAPTQALALLSVGWCSRIQDKEHTTRRLAAKSGRS